MDMNVNTSIDNNQIILLVVGIAVAGAIIIFLSKLAKG